MIVLVVFSQGLPRIGRSARAFARTPGLSVALLLTIALGVGSNAAIYGFLQGMTHPSQPLRDRDRIVSIFEQDRSREAGPLSPGEYESLEKRDGIFEWIGAARIRPVDTLIEGQAETSTVAAASPSLASALTIALGNGVVISHRMWEKEFGGRADAVGSTIRIDGADYKICAVAPARLEGLYNDRAVDLWIPLRERDLEADGDRRDLWVLARLRGGVSIRSAQTTLRSASAGSGEIVVTAFTGISPAMALGLARVGLFLGFSAAVVLFIAGINVASILLGRALRRSHETSLRIALGATREELLRDLVADSVVISAAGGALGGLLGVVTGRILPALLFSEDAERLRFATHWIPILAAASVCMVITGLCGMLPVIGTVTDRPWIILQRETGSPPKGIQRLRSGLVIGQITACCMLVICTALLQAGLHSALVTSAGHQLGNPILVTVQAQVWPDGPLIDPRYFSEVEKKAKTVAGLSPLAWMARLPGNQPMWRIFRIQRLSQEYRDIALDIEWLTPDSVQSLERTAGRMPRLGDQGRAVAMVDERAAEEIFGQQTPGVVILNAGNQPVEIIGVVKRKSTDAKQARPTIYYVREDRPATATIRSARFRVPLAAPESGVELSANVVSANYFSALGTTPIAGKTFSENRAPGSGRVAVINQEAADFYFNGKPIGAGVIDAEGMRTEIVGVVRSQTFGTFQQHVEPAIYFPLWQDYPPRMTLMLKHSQWNSAILADLRSTVESVPGRSPGPVVINTLDNQLAQSGLAGLRIAILIGGASAAIALLLSILGLLSAQSDAEQQRQSDRALRIALGSQRWRIVAMVMTNAARLALAGTVIGVSFSYAFYRLLIAEMSVMASPPLQVWLIAPLVPAILVTLVSMIPARRVSLISPLTIMRDM